MRTFDMKNWAIRDGRLWRPQSPFASAIGSRAQLAAFNDDDSAAVHFDVLRASAPDIVLHGAKNETFCLWETRSASGFVTQPRYSARLVTVRFVTRGQITYRQRHGQFLGRPDLATFMGFEEVRQVEASPEFGALSASIAFDLLTAAYGALTGDEAARLPLLEPVAEVADEGMRALFHTVARMQRRIDQGPGQDADLLPLLQEVMCYQLLSAWPKKAGAPARTPEKVPRDAVRAAMDYVEASPARSMSLAEIAAAAGVGVRALQRAFRAETGRSLAAHVIARRASCRRREPALPQDAPAASAQSASAAPAGRATSPARTDMLIRAHRLIEQELHRPDLNPAWVAERLGISVRKLHVAFEPGGVSVSRYVLARRLARADRLLNERSRMPVTQAAYASGFESLSTFFRCYRAAYGASPGERRAI